MVCDCHEKSLYDPDLGSGRIEKGSCLDLDPEGNPQSKGSEEPTDHVCVGMVVWEIVKSLLEDQNLERLLPKLISDTHAALLTWIVSKQGQGIIQPFDLLRRLIFHLTLRVISVPEIANNHDVRDRTLGKLPFNTDKNNATAHEKWLVDQLRLHGKIDAVVRRRKRQRVYWKKRAPKAPKLPHMNDAMEDMIDKDLDKQTISNMIIRTAASSLEEFGSPASWVLCFIGQDRIWCTRVQKEVDSVIAKHRKYENEHPADVIRRLSFDSWQTEFPTVNLCIYDTFRVHRAMRGAVDGTSTTMQSESSSVRSSEDGRVVEQSSLTADTTVPPEDPFKDGLEWDPSGFKGDTSWDAFDEHDMTYSPIACGTSLDKLELTITTVMFVAHYHFSVCDDSGDPAENLNENLKHLDPHMPSKVYLKCRVRVPCVDWDKDVEERRHKRTCQEKQKSRKDQQGKKKNK